MKRRKQQEFIHSESNMNFSKNNQGIIGLVKEKFSNA